MTYIELLNNFWDSTRFDPCSSNEAAMYFYLLHQCNIRRWINPFELETRNLELTLGITRKSISAIRNKLKQRGFIEFAKGRGSGCAVYQICHSDVTDESLYKKICVSSVNTKVNTKVNTNANCSLLREEIRLKTKDKSSVADATATQREASEPSLFAEEEKKAKRKKPQSAKDPPAVPTLEDVRKYFLSQDADKRLENWEESARRFYDNFNAVGWRDKFNRLITRWDSRANSWIVDDETNQQKRKQNEKAKTNQAPTDRGRSPSAGVPIRGRVVPQCGLKRRDESGED